ncbi:hypothetical protein HDV00_006443 [Rhizophlyctis rosea]|nr:hypothetical protein HDV00_006443 [Rhizophlyctis rosea]
MITRQNLSSNSRFEPIIGYSRAVKVGNVIYVSGTTGTDPASGVLAKGDAYAQTKQTLANIASALSKFKATPADIVRTRIYIVDIKRNWEVCGRAHSEMFSTILPAATMVEVSGLIDKDMLVEIEVDAVLGTSVL